GVDYFRHDGRIQDVQGNLFDTSKSSLMVGAGPSAVFALSDAIFGPLAARQVVRARNAGLQTALNDSLLAVAEAYFNVQQAPGAAWGGGRTARGRGGGRARPRGGGGGGGGGGGAGGGGGGPPPGSPRRDQAVDSARERWRTASAELVRVLRLDPTVLVQPLEP